MLIQSWVVQMVPVMLEAFELMKYSHGSTIGWTPKDLVLWIDSLKYYPTPEDESIITRYLLDAGRRLFNSR